MAPQGAPLQQGRGQGRACGSWSSCHASWGGSGTGEKRTGVTDVDVRTHPCPPLRELGPQASGSATCSVLGPRSHWRGTPAGLLLGELSCQRCDPRPNQLPGGPHSPPHPNYAPTADPSPSISLAPQPFPLLSKSSNYDPPVFSASRGLSTQPLKEARAASSTICHPALGWTTSRGRSLHLSTAPHTTAPLHPSWPAPWPPLHTVDMCGAQQDLMG